MKKNCDACRLVARVRHMEESFDRVRSAVDTLHRDLDAYEELQEQVRELDAYQRSGQWLQDYEADERGGIPSDVQRGVLSLDGLYDLLQRIDELKGRMAVLG